MLLVWKPQVFVRVHFVSSHRNRWMFWSWEPWRVLASFSWRSKMSLEALLKASAGLAPSCQASGSLEVSRLAYTHISLIMTYLVQASLWISQAQPVFPGPVASVACAKLGIRVTSIMGALFVTVGFLVSIFATNVVYLYISMGLIVGECPSINRIEQTSPTMLVCILYLLKQNIHAPCRYRLRFPVPGQLCCHGNIFPEEAGHCVFHRPLRNGPHVCSCSFHTAASGSLCLARWIFHHPISLMKHWRPIPCFSHSVAVMAASRNNSNGFCGVMLVLEALSLPNPILHI